MKLGTLLHLFKSTVAAAGEEAPAAAEGRIAQPFDAVLHETRTSAMVAGGDGAASAQPPMPLGETPEGEGAPVVFEEASSTTRPADTQVLKLLQHSGDGEPDSRFPTPEAVRDAFRRILVAATQPESSQPTPAPQAASPVPEESSEAASGSHEALPEAVIVTEGRTLKSDQSEVEDSEPTLPHQPTPDGEVVVTQHSPILLAELGKAPATPPLETVEPEAVKQAKLPTPDPRKAQTAPASEASSFSAQPKTTPTDGSYEEPIAPEVPAASLRTPASSRQAAGPVHGVPDTDIHPAQPETVASVSSVPEGEATEAGRPRVPQPLPQAQVSESTQVEVAAASSATPFAEAMPDPQAPQAPQPRVQASAVTPEVVRRSQAGSPPSQSVQSGGHVFDAPLVAEGSEAGQPVRPSAHAPAPHAANAATPEARSAEAEIQVLGQASIAGPAKDESVGLAPQDQLNVEEGVEPTLEPRVPITAQAAKEKPGAPAQAAPVEGAVEHFPAAAAPEKGKAVPQPSTAGEQKPEPASKVAEQEPPLRSLGEKQLVSPSAETPGAKSVAPDAQPAPALQPKAQPVEASQADSQTPKVQHPEALPDEAHPAEGATRRAGVQDELPARPASTRRVERPAPANQGTTVQEAAPDQQPLASSTSRNAPIPPAPETTATVPDAESLPVQPLVQNDAATDVAKDPEMSSDDAALAGGSEHANDSETLTDRPVTKTARRHDAMRQHREEGVPEQTASSDKTQAPAASSPHTEPALTEEGLEEKATSELPELSPLDNVADVPADERAVAPPAERAMPQAERSAAVASERSDFQGRPVPAAWLRTILGGARSLTATQQGWHVMQFNLDEGDGTVTIRARREDGRVAVSVGFSDPELRALAVASADRLQEALQTEYEAPVDLSLFSGDAGESGQQQDGATGSRQRGGSGAAAEVDAPAETTARRTMPLGTRHEWVG